jgi:hypothetical protein
MTAQTRCLSHELFSKTGIVREGEQPKFTHQIRLKSDGEMMISRSAFRMTLLVAYVLYGYAAAMLSKLSTDLAHVKLHRATIVSLRQCNNGRTRGQDPADCQLYSVCDAASRWAGTVVALCRPLVCRPLVCCRLSQQPSIHHFVLAYQN